MARALVRIQAQRVRIAQAIDGARYAFPTLPSWPWRIGAIAASILTLIAVTAAVGAVVPVKFLVVVVPIGPFFLRLMRMQVDLGAARLTLATTLFGLPLAKVSLLLEDIREIRVLVAKRDALRRQADEWIAVTANGQEHLLGPNLPEWVRDELVVALKQAVAARHQQLLGAAAPSPESEAALDALRGASARRGAESR